MNYNKSLFPRVLRKKLRELNEDYIELEKKGKRQRAYFDFSIHLPQKKREEDIMLDVEITNEQKVEVTLSPKTATGKPAKLDGKPTWTVTSGESTVSVADDGLSAFLVSGDTPGDTVVLIEADADVGSGTQTISDIIKLHILGALADNLGIAVGTPVAK